MANPFYGVAKALRNRLFPDRNGPAGLEYKIPFNTNGVTSYSDQLQLQPVKLEWVTGAYIDNGNNPQPVTLTIADTGQEITVPARSQASIELLGLNGDSFSFVAQSTGNVDVKVVFLNYVPSSANAIWSVLDPSTPAGTITVDGSVIALPTDADSTDRSRTIVAANTPEILMNANAARRILNIMNPYANANLTNGGILTVSFSVSKIYGQAGGYDIAPGGAFKLDGLGMPNEIIYISSTDAGAVVSALEI